MSYRVRVFLCSIPLIFCVGLIWWLSSLPQPPSPFTEIEFHDKFEHWVAFASVGISAGIALRAYGIQNRSVLLWCAFTVASAYGFLDEIHQAFVPNRSVSALDWLADCIGAISAVWILPWLLQQKYLRAFINSSD
jgi:VanZ family protein